MNLSNAILGGLALASTTALLTTQGASEPARSAPEYFVTSEGHNAHLWVREANNLRVVGHGTCKSCPLEAEGAHEHGDGHDHDKPGAK
jgi:hypothetical protein